MWILHPLIERKRDQWFAPDVDLNMDDITTRDDKGDRIYAVI